MEPLEKVIERLSPAGERICQALRDKAGRLGVASSRQVVADWNGARFSLSRDPFSGTDSLVGIWKNDSGMDCGKIIFHDDQSGYAEFDIMKPHSQYPGMIILAIEAWLSAGEVKTDVQLMPDPESGVRS
ncbi:MAG: hypothetical protein ACYCXP_03185 [Leptospirillum sp.]|jgi:hypothetical protein|nr:hypothetical protein [Nitrospiraceae bacterium]